MIGPAPAGGVQEQTGEKLDRLGLLLTREASKPRTAEPKLLGQNEPPSIDCEPRSDASDAPKGRTRGLGAEEARTDVRTLRDRFRTFPWLPNRLSSMLAGPGNHHGNTGDAARPALCRQNARSALFLGYAENP